MRNKKILCLICCFLCHFSVYAAQIDEKVLICGIARNVASAAPNTIKNAEKLGNQFKNYAVIIYENNSTDNTVELFKNWAKNNSHVIFVHENMPDTRLAIARTEKIARARNKILSIARRSQYKGFKYLVMVDLDFLTDWPICEIVRTIASPIKWDAVFANGCVPSGSYYDRYALRNKQFPFGPELLGDFFWSNSRDTVFKLKGRSWVPTYSAFGGLAIYKTKSILRSSYSGTVTKDLKKYYKKIIRSLSVSNPSREEYLKLISPYKVGNRHSSEIPVIFRKNTLWEVPSGYQGKVCCEHVPLHASMYMKGCGKFYINPKMYMRIL